VTKKYASVHQPLIARLQLETEKGHKKSADCTKAVKSKLHQLYGAYTQDNAHKKAAAAITMLEQCLERDNSNTSLILDTATSLLSLHASTKERLPYYAQFYEFILSHTDPVESILDIGCGYNPFSIPYLLAAANDLQLCPTTAVNLKSYHAYDIDTRVAILINRFCVCLGLPSLALCEDLAVYTPNAQADIALMCKLIPVLEAQAPGSGYKLARELNTRYLLITYPLKSLGGREKGMSKHYTAAFEKAMASGELGKFMLLGHKYVGNEILYMLEAKAT